MASGRLRESAACGADAKKLQFIEELTTNTDVVQLNVLAEILSRNAKTEYLRRYKLGSATDRKTFKAMLPVVTYEDLLPEIWRIANGDRSAILSSHPVSEFLTSSGTPTGERKLMPTIEEKLAGLIRGCVEDLNDERDGSIREGEALSRPWRY